MSKMSRWAKRVQHTAREFTSDTSSVISGYREFKRDGVTPEAAYSSMRRLYRTTNGRFNDAVGLLCKTIHRKRAASLPESLFDDATNLEVKQIGASLKKDGFYKFPRQIPKELCDHLLDFSLQKLGTSVSLQTPPPPETRFDRANPKSVRHQFSSSTLFEDESIQQLCTDPYFQAIAAEYLGFNPVLDLLSMWWSAPGDAALQSRAAQLYHFDMDRFKFVKFFIYLTDVDTNNGPHCYVRGSHTRKPAALLKDGRLTDEEILGHYATDELIELTGPAGTLLAVDTRGFHKGKPLLERDRLIFQIQFSDSLFGQNYPPVSVPRDISETTSKRLSGNRRCYANFETS
jgi:hypothetical protein